MTQIRIKTLFRERLCIPGREMETAASVRDHNLFDPPSPKLWRVALGIQRTAEDIPKTLMEREKRVLMARRFY